ncbi:MAG: 2-hydroxyacyl-CoA dehydratase [Deltaproteobacteria bacterium]|nr:2-hydroxyacyl-CoA dehydratase [Deltaproteobacteria bacterium]
MTQPGVIKKIRSAGPLKDLMGTCFRELDHAAREGSAKVAWCTSVGPAELLRAFFQGIVYHDAKTCPNNSNSRHGMPERIAKKLGIPYVVLCADLNDLRIYSEEQARTQFEALVEEL